MDLTSNQAAAFLKIAGGALRSIELGLKPCSLALAYRASRLYQCHVDDLLAQSGGEGVPDDPPQKEQEQETNTAPPKRKDQGKKGPKRTNGVAA
jgi:hypothetical protein